ncbi:sensor histidine kinase [Halarchaeum sp. P4]|uniref:sensor histidine kinase n=1 Tax=Halarchaeum sp. P4 TaxID=3421639 RepID=UPI003EBAA571
MNASYRYLRIGLLGVGCLLLAVQAVELAVQLVGPTPLTISLVASILMSAPCAALLALGVYRLPRLQISTAFQPRILAWTLGGLLFFGGFIALFAMISYRDPLMQLGTLRWGFSVGGGLGFLVGYLNARSVDALLEAERATVQAEEAQRQQRLLEYVNAILRHEVLNTVTVISGYAELIKDGSAEDPQEAASTIYRQSTEMASVIEDVRILTETATGETTKEPVDVTAVLADELERLRDRYPQVDVTRQLPEEAYVRADPLLKRLFSNLLNNAVEHNDADQPRVEVTVTTTGRTVTVEIADNGPGIAEPTREELFDSEPRNDTTHGLGLTIVGLLAERYDGHVELTETGDAGSVFTVELPRAASPEETQSGQPA